MIVEFDTSARDSALDAAIFDEISLYAGSGSNQFAVLGILFPHDACPLYLINLRAESSLIVLASSRFFRIIDASASRMWKVFPEIANSGLLYPGVDLALFGYVGIDRLISEATFFENYLNDDSAAVEFILQMERSISREAHDNLLTTKLRAD